MSDASSDTAKVPDAEEQPGGAGETAIPPEPAQSGAAETEHGAEADSAMGDASTDTAKTPDADDV